MSRHCFIRSVSGCKNIPVVAAAGKHENCPGLEKAA
jgi:hypothetical protein